MIKLNRKDLVGGIVIIALGIFILVHAVGFGLGSASRMGPGYVPALLGVAMILLGSIMAWNSPSADAQIPPIAWRPVAAVTGGMSVFALSAQTVGLIPAVIFLVTLASLGDRSSRLLKTAVLAISVAIGMWLIFVVGLKVAIPAFRLDF